MTNHYNRFVGEVVLAHAWLCMIGRGPDGRPVGWMLCVSPDPLASGYVAPVLVPSVQDRQKREWVAHRSYDGKAQRTPA